MGCEDSGICQPTCHDDLGTYGVLCIVLIIAFSVHLLALTYVTILNWYYIEEDDPKPLQSAACSYLSMFCKKFVPKKSIYAYDNKKSYGSIVKENDDDDTDEILVK